jgi:hypothetical protein
MANDNKRRGGRLCPTPLVTAGTRDTSKKVVMVRAQRAPDLFRVLGGFCDEVAEADEHGAQLDALLLRLVEAAKEA